MQDFAFALPTRVIFGPAMIDTAGKQAAGCGTHALVVTSSAFARRSGLLDHLTASLLDAGVAVSLHEIERQPDVAILESGGRKAREDGVDVVIGLGGGSALDAAKAVAVAATTDRPMWDFAEHNGRGEPARVEDALPIVQVPIVASTGSETNDTAVLFNPELRMKAPVSSPHLFAKVAIVDPTLTFSVPTSYTAIGGINIVSQLIEAYLTSDEFAVRDRIAEGIVRTVMDALSRAMHHGEDLDARSNLSWASALASTMALAGRASSTPLRAMAYPLTAHFDVEHGRVLSALWPSYMRYVLANRFRLPQVGRYKRYSLLGRHLFGVHETDDEVAAETTVYRFRSWLRGMDMPTSLAQLGIENAPVSELAQQAVTVSGNGRRLPGGLSEGDIEHIYETALRPA